MNLNFSKLNNVLRNAILIPSVLAYSAASNALDKMDLTQDASGGKDFSAVAEKQDTNFGLAGTLVCLFFALAGIVIAGIGIFSIYKAGKDGARESAGPGVIALCCGGALTSVSVLVWVIKNSII
jgi:hypothetical protein